MFNLHKTYCLYLQYGVKKEPKLSLEHYKNIPLKINEMSDVAIKVFFLDKLKEPKTDQK
jgi:hypothetical protein